MKKLLKKMTALVLTAVTVMTASVFTRAEAIDTMTAQQIVEDMKIGWNLGNSLDAYSQSYSNPAASETSWSNPVTTKAMIDKVKAAGFNTVRVPVTWYDKSDSNGVIYDTWLARVKEVVDYGIQNDMYVIINLHHEDGGSGKNGWLIPDNNHKAANEARLKAVWTQIADYFKNYDRHLIFEAMNEPRIVGSGEEWTGGTMETRAVINSYNATAVKAIRATGGNNTKRLVMCPPCAAKIDALNGFEMPDDDNVAVSIHNYSPYQFAMNQYGTADWGSDADKAALKNEIVNLYNRFVAKGIPVVIGEMGATNKSSTPDKRNEWATYYTSTAKTYGITCVVWDNNKIYGDGENFGLLNRGSLTWYFPELVEALVKGVDEGAVLEPDEPIAGGSDAYTTVIFNGSVGAEGWAQPYKEDMKNLPEITEGCKIAVEYSADNPPYLVFQIYDESNEQWNQMLPDYTEGGVAYYSYDTIKNNCKGDISQQQQMLVMSNTDYTTITKISIIYPTKQGDVNSDAKIDRLDAVIILRALSNIKGLTKVQRECADFNNDGVVDMLDVVEILNA